MLRCATLLETMDSGTLAYGENVAAREENGKSVYAGKAALAKVRRQFGLVFQQFDLFPHYTVLKNVCDAPIRHSPAACSRWQRSSPPTFPRPWRCSTKWD